MKKNFYIGLFVFLGILVQFLVHGLVEIWYINLLTKDFSSYSFGLPWQGLFIAHQILTIFLLIIGILAGFKLGNFFWNKFFKKS